MEWLKSITSLLTVIYTTIQENLNFCFVCILPGSSRTIRILRPQMRWWKDRSKTLERSSKLIFSKINVNWRINKLISSKQKCGFNIKMVPSIAFDSPPNGLTICKSFAFYTFCCIFLDYFPILLASYTISWFFFQVSLHILRWWIRLRICCLWYFPCPLRLGNRNLLTKID